MDNSKQVGGTHYDKLKISPFEYAEENELSALEFSVVKYVSRHKLKNGKEDLLKARHCLDLLIKKHYL